MIAKVSDLSRLLLALALLFTYQTVRTNYYYRCRQWYLLLS